MDEMILCAIAKCENKYIFEWVVWHLRLGFDKIVIYDNNDVDGEKISDIVGDMQNVEIVDWRGRKQGSCETQVAAYNDCYKKHMDSEWIMFLDIDEFLEFRSGLTLKRFLNYTWSKKANVIKFHWKCYSDNDYIEEQNGLVTETYTQLCSNRNTNVNTKSIYKCGIENFKILNIHFSNITEKIYYQSGMMCLNPYGTSDNNINYDNGWVRHYVTKSMEEFVNIKYARRNPGSSKQRLNSSFYFKYNKKTPEKEQKLNELFENMNSKPIHEKHVIEKDLEETNDFKELQENQKELEELVKQHEDIQKNWWERMIPKKKPSVYDLQRHEKKVEADALTEKVVEKTKAFLQEQDDVIDKKKIEQIEHLKEKEENKIEKINRHSNSKNADVNLPPTQYEYGISVCISAWNAAEYIEECLDSVVNQSWFKTHDNWEILLGIDGCEETLKKVKKIMHNYKNLTVFMMNENVGTYITCNTIMQKSKYTRLLRFDSDDVMYEDMVETLMERYADYDFVTPRCNEVFDRKAQKFWAEGQMFFTHELFDTYGGYQPWRCAADTELRTRTKSFVKQANTPEAYLYRRPHENRLTKNKDTNGYSEYRNEKKLYIKNVSPFVEKIITVTTDCKIIYKKTDNIILSFTTWKKRHDCAAIMLEHLKQQTLKPDKIICWLSSDEYNGENVPKSLKPFVKEGYIEVRWVKENTYCHKRYETFKEHKNDYVFLIDDDIYYNPNYLQDMYNAALEHNDCIICYCGQMMEFDKEKNLLPLLDNPSIKNTILSGLTCYPPGVFPFDEYFDEANLKMRDAIAPKCDDSYLQMFSIKNGIEVYCLHDRTTKKFRVVKEYQDVGIWEENKQKINGINKKTKIVKKLMYAFDLEEKCKKIWPNIIF